MIRIPFILVFFRIALAPVMIYSAWKYGEASGLFLAGMLIAGILSDIFDGIIARKVNVSTDSLRKWDSNADLLFLLSVLVSAYIIYPMSIEFEAGRVLILFFSELLMYAICFIRFKKSPANHAYLSKFFAVVICIALCSLFITASWGIWFDLLFYAGLLSYFDNFLILLLLPEYRVDTKSFLLLIRKRN